MSFAGAAKVFGDVRAVDGIDLAIRRGETVALLGRNGAGKSTAISLMLGLNEPDAGRVELFGGAPGAGGRAGRVGAMLQDGRPIPRVTVRELVTFVAAHLSAAAAGRRGAGSGRAHRARGPPRRPALRRPDPARTVRRRAGRQPGADHPRRADRGTGRRGAARLLGRPCAAMRRAATPCSSPPTTWRRPTTTPTGSSSSTTAGSSPTAAATSSSARPAAVSSPSTWPGAGTEGLTLLPGVVSVEVRGDRARLRTDDSDATVVALAGLGAIRGLEVAPVSLEDVFLALTATPELETVR